MVLFEAKQNDRKGLIIMMNWQGIPLMPLLWLVAIVVLTIVEVATYQLVAVWFAVGGIAALIASIFYAGTPVQVAVFVAVSLLSLIVTRPLVKKTLKVKRVQTNFDRILGATGIVISKITPEEKGRILVDGLDWSASCPGGATVLEGEKVIIREVVGVTAIVEKLL